MMMMMLGWFIVVILIIAFVAMLVGPVSTWGKPSWPRDDHAGNERSALRTLEERFASGEIDREEFERRREVLSHQDPMGIGRTHQRHE